MFKADNTALDYSQFSPLTNFIVHPTVYKFLHSEAKTRCTFKGNQGGGCLRIGSKIQMLDGTIKAIENINAGDKILSIGDDYKILPSVVTTKIDSGVKQLFTIKTKNGREITATPCHPFLTIDGWESVVDLKVGSRIAVPRELKVDTRKWDEYKPWAYKILGYLIGDGCAINDVKFSNIDQNIINEIQSFLPEGLSIKRESKDQTRCDYRISGENGGGNGSNQVRNLLKEVGIFGKNSYTKFVPDIIFKTKEKNIALFLSRLFSCDGWVDDRGIGYASVSKELICGVQSLLLRFGILSRVRAKVNNHWGTNSKRTDERTDYHLTIQRFTDLEKFSCTIGIFSKQAKLNSLIERRRNASPKENCDTIPINTRDLYKKLETQKANTKKQGKQWEYKNRNEYEKLRECRGETISREKAGEIGLMLGNEKLLHLSKSDVLWDKIASIEDVGKSQCYDLTIDGTHNFVADNIFAHNTATHMYDLVLRLLGIHEIKWRNEIKAPIRLISKVQPKGNDDVLNQQYVELKKLLPYEQIVRDITTHPPAIMTVKNPYGGSQNYMVELMSSQQEIDAFMSVQRQTLYIDEELEKMKYDENQIRLLAMNGDTNIALTPVRGLDWTYDVLWRRARKICRSQTISDKYGFPMEETFNNENDIECFCWATDDNPILTKDTIERIFENIVDPDDLAMRRYGVFKQATGQIYKGFNVNIHKISVEKYWSEVLFKTFWQYRIIDYHPTKPWYVTFVAISPKNERFIWNEWVASHDTVTTFELRDTIKRKSLVKEDDEFNRKTLIDPLAKQKQPNSGYSMFEDISRGDSGLRRVQEADTKNEQGRMNVKMWLQNSLKCEVPFNNKRTDGEKDPRFDDRLPTLWFFENCREHIEHFRNWRSIDYRTELAKATHDDRRLIQKWSDFCRNLEFLGNLNPVFYNSAKNTYEPPRQFTGRV